MKTLSRGKVVLGLALTMPLLGTGSIAYAGQCRGDKTVQSCTTTTAMPTSEGGSTQSCEPVKVPCNYPDNVRDAMPRLFAPLR